MPKTSTELETTLARLRNELRGAKSLRRKSFSGYEQALATYNELVAKYLDDLNEIAALPDNDFNNLLKARRSAYIAEYQAEQPLANAEVNALSSL